MVMKETAKENYYMVGRESLKGFILEEIIAYLIQNTGYNLLVDPVQDSRELDRRGNGLVVKGRGAVHQADVLGQLVWIPAFTFPLRLFVEAKCRNAKTGIPDVRNAVGILDDINQNYSPVREGKALIQRFSYRYALFSTSGFTSTASDMALAHQISLVDLSGPDFANLRDLLEDVADVLLSNLKLEVVNNGTNLDNDANLQNDRKPKMSLIQLFRIYLRGVLNTWPSLVMSPLDSNERNYLRSKLPDLGLVTDIIQRGVDRYREFFVGMANGPFLLIFKTDNPEAFLSYVERNPSHRVTISWTSRNNLERQWEIRPVNNSEAYTLSFGLPQSLGDWIFGDDERATHRALNAKERFLSDITIYRFVDGKDQLIRLLYDARATKDYVKYG